MAIFGRSQSTTPVIVKRLIQFQPAAPVASKPLVVSFASLNNRRPVPFTRIISRGLIRYQPIAPTAGKPFIVSQVAFEFRRPQVLRPTVKRTVAFQLTPVARAPYIATLWPRESTRRPHFETITNRLIQYQPIAPTAKKPLVISQAVAQSIRPIRPAPTINGLIQYSPIAPTAQKPIVISQIAVEFRRPQILRPSIGKTVQFQRFPVARAPYIASLWPREASVRPHRGVIINRRIQFAPPAGAAPVAAKPFIVGFVAHNFRRPEFHGPIFNRLYRFQVVTPGIARPPFIVSHVSHDEAKRRNHILSGPLKVVTAPVIPAIPRLRPKIKIKHDEARIGSRGRGHEQEVARIINELARTGELIGSVSNPAIGYLAADPSAVGTTEVLPISEVLDRIIAYIKSQNGTGI